MIPYIRRQKILDYMDGKDVVYLKDIAAFLSRSVSTVRRDLVGLEKEGLVKLLNGGAATLQSRSYDLPVEKSGRPTSRPRKSSPARRRSWWKTGT